MSAPTVRFLRTVEQLRLLPTTDRNKLAAMVYSGIKPLVGIDDLDALRLAAAEAQDSRWRLVSADTSTDDLELVCISLIEQWLLAQTELTQPKTPVMEVLAGKRAEVIERFIRDHLSFESGDVIYLRDHVARSKSERPSKSAASG